MLKLEIKLDEEKVRAEQKYSPAAIYSALDKAFLKHHFRKEELADGTLCYYGNGQARDYGTFGRLITSLKDQDWFTPYLSNGSGTIAMTGRMRRTLPWKMCFTITPTGRAPHNGSKRSAAL